MNDSDFNTTNLAGQEKDAARAPRPPSLFTYKGDGR